MLVRPRRSRRLNHREFHGHPFCRNKHAHSPHRAWNHCELCPPLLKIAKGVEFFPPERVSNCKKGVTMLRSVLLSTAALALVATTANASPKVTLSHDNRYVSVEPAKGMVNVPNLAPKHYQYSTFSKEKEALYFCCYGSTLSGPSSFFGAAYGVAEQFIPNANMKITTLAAGVGYVSGDKSVTLTLYADNGSNGVGAQLAQGTGTAAVEYGFCCGVTTASISSTSLTAGTPYWVAITTTGANFEAAGFQDSDEVDNNVYVASTTNGGTTWGTSVLETEYDPSIGVK